MLAHKVALTDLDLLTHLGQNLNKKIRDKEKLRDLLIQGLLKIRTRTRGLVPMNLNHAQQEYSRNCSKRNIVLKARQLGMTTYVAARFFIHTITQPGTLTVQVAHTQESAEEIFRIVHRFWENLPEALQRGALLRSRANIRQIAFPQLDSEYRVATAADPNAGRGMTIHNLHCSEVARWPRDGAETLASLRSAVPDGGEIVLESTPNGAGGIFYEEWQRAAATGYIQHFFPWWYETSYECNDSSIDAFTSEEEELIQHAQLNKRQIAWRRINRSQLRGLAVQEFAEDPLSCFLASGECVFDLNAVAQAFAESGEAFESRENEKLKIWLPPQNDKQYLIGVDPAGGGVDGDYSCAQVIDRLTGLQCAELRGHFPLREFASKLIVLANSYNRALLVVERNNHGHGVLAHLQSLGYPNLYREQGQYGWLTSSVTRPAMIENLAAALVTEPALFKSQHLLNEFRTFVRHSDGSSAAVSGTHDDCVMAMAVAWASRQKISGLQIYK